MHVRNVAAQAAEELKTVTYATPPMEERRERKKKDLALWLKTFDKRNNVNQKKLQVQS